METDLHARTEDRDAEHRLHHGIHRRDDGAEEVWREGRCQAEEKSSESKKTSGGEGERGRGGGEEKEGEREGERDQETKFPSSFETPP